MKLFLLLFSLLVCGCSGITGQISIIQANYRFSQGDFNEAIQYYQKALEYPDTAPYAQYGLGTLYYAIGEDNAALVCFNDALERIKNSSNENQELRFCIYYNSGLVFFNKRDYNGAINSFRQALKTDAGRIEAKRNLELSIRSLDRENENKNIQINDQQDSDQIEKINEGRNALFEYVRQKEFNQWQSREWQDEEQDAGADY
ncbi:MAG: tetratricopeptide repeat protein [Treponema sp.]|nr:tetratricopeptide repeat protein [Treponema sp.]